VKKKNKALKTYPVNVVSKGEELHVVAIMDIILFFFSELYVS